MSLKTLDQEEKILNDIQNGTAVRLERALLVLSGLKTDEELRSYELKIDGIYGRFLKKCDDQYLFDRSRLPLYLHRPIAKSLFEYLWSSKPNATVNPSSYRSGRCSDQLQCAPFCRNMRCLTSLYSVLGLRAGLKLSLLGALDHLLNRLRVGSKPSTLITPIHKV